jgi:F-type H+-transporting ATPase subunit c
MKLIKSIVLAGALLLLAQSSANAQAPTATSGPAPFSDLRAIGCGIIVLGAALGIGMLAKGAFESMARQPEIEGNIRTTSLIIAAFIEGFTFFALLIVFMK